MRPRNTSQDPNQGEGDKASARHYNRDVREFVAEGKVEEAAEEARLYVERDPEDAARAEERAKRGPTRSKGVSTTVDQLIAKGMSVVDRVRPYVERASQKLRSRFGRK
ncbi:MAG: hypothetical protein M4D80_17955 [Myxococcota bacterium]|nr:hypothetical protein [Myxococcota bacterium]